MVFITCIVALIDKEKIYIGGDRLATDGVGTKYNLQMKKVWKKGNEMIFGSAGSVRGFQLLAHGSAIPPIKKGQSIEEYLVLDLADAMKKALALGGELHDKHGIETGFNHMILGYEGRLFSFYEDMAYIEIVDKYTAIGSGSRFALGSLYSTEKMDMSSEDRIKLALKSAQKFNAYVQEPYDIISLKKPNVDPIENVMDNILSKANRMMEEDE